MPMVSHRHHRLSSSSKRVMGVSLRHGCLPRFSCRTALRGWACGSEPMSVANWNDRIRLRGWTAMVELESVCLICDVVCSAGLGRQDRAIESPDLEMVLRGRSEWKSASRSQQFGSGPDTRIAER